MAAPGTPGGESDGMNAGTVRRIAGAAVFEVKRQMRNERQPGLVCGDEACEWVFAQETRGERAIARLEVKRMARGVVHRRLQT